MRVHRRPIPPLVMEIAARRIGWLLAPWIRAFAAVRRAVRRAVPLCLSGQFLAGPSRVGRSFRVSNVHRPRERQINFAEHRAVAPARPRTSCIRARTSAPEMRMCELLPFSPSPIFGLPELFGRIATRFDEFQILA